jgi:rod shape-determining protein MreD
VQPWFVGISLLCALMLNILPWGNWIWVPDWLALALLFWGSREPRLVGFGVAFILGLLMDVHNAVILGEHAFTYVILAFAASILSRRLPSFEPLYQTVQIWPVLLIAQLLSLTLRSFFGGDFPGWAAALISPTVTAALWPIALAILLIPQRKPLDTDVNRPL